MKKITATLLVIFCFIAFSCSDDDGNQNSGIGELKLSGTVMSPKNAFPISRAKVKVFQGTALIAQQTTDALGNFVVENLPTGELNVELSKGKFKKYFTLDMTSDYVLASSERNFDVFPEIVVVTGSFDAIEDILFDIGVVDDQGAPAFDVVSGSSARTSQTRSHHGDVAARSGSIQPNVNFTFMQLLLDPATLNSYDIVFLNCGASEDFSTNPVALANLKSFIANGGVVYATDFMYKYIQPMFSPDGVIQFSQPEKSGTSVVADVQLAGTDLGTWLVEQGIEIAPSVTFTGFLGSWQMVDSVNPDVVQSWLVANSVIYNNIPVSNKPLAYTFAHGCGGVFYSSFHTHGDGDIGTTLGQVMNFYLFELAALGGECGTES